MVKNLLDVLRSSRDFGASCFFKGWQKIKAGHNWFFGFDHVKPFRPLTYLAVPYTHADARVRELRYRAANEAMKYLIEHGHNVFSPITHSHPLHLLGLDGDWSFWQKVDTDYLKCCHTVCVLTIPGWRESTGVQAEIKIAQDLGLPIEHFPACNLSDALYVDLILGPGRARIAGLDLSEFEKESENTRSQTKTPRRTGSVRRSKRTQAKA